MIKILINRLIQSVPVILGAVTISFVMIHIAPGDPVDAVLGNRAAADAREALREKLGLDQPLWNQYIQFF